MARKMNELFPLTLPTTNRNEKTKNRMQTDQYDLDYRASTTPSQYHTHE
jgi:hypothetical protein